MASSISDNPSAAAGRSSQIKADLTGPPPASTQVSVISARASAAVIESGGCFMVRFLRRPQWAFPVSWRIGGGEKLLAVIWQWSNYSE
jgi:hypothetical protein